MRNWYRIILFMALTTPLFASNVLVLGDSQSVGPFGERLFQHLNSNGHNTLSVASCGSTADDWFNFRGSCGVRTRKSGVFLDKYTPNGATPLLSELILENKPDVVIMEFGGNYTDNKDDEFIISSVKRMVKAVKDSGAKCLWVNNPDKRYMREGLKRVWDLMEIAVGDECPIFRSQDVTRYPDVDENGDGKLDGDGRHYDFPAGIPVANAWADEVFKKFQSLYPEKSKKGNAFLDFLSKLAGLNATKVQIKEGPVVDCEKLEDAKD